MKHLINININSHSHVTRKAGGREEAMSKHQIDDRWSSLLVEKKRADDASQDSRTCLAKPTTQARTRTSKKTISPAQPTPRKNKKDWTTVHGWKPFVPIRDRFVTHLRLQHPGFPITRDAKRPGVSLYAIDGSTTYFSSPTPFLSLLHP